MWTESAKDVSRTTQASGLKTPRKREDVMFRRKDVSAYLGLRVAVHLLLPGDQFHHERIQPIPVPVSVVLHHVVFVEDAVQPFLEVLCDTAGGMWTHPAPNRFLFDLQDRPRVRRAQLPEASRAA